MTSQKCCYLAVNGWRRMRPIAGVLAISYKEEKMPLSLFADRGAETAGGATDGWGRLRPVNAVVLSQTS